jgi:hypothetical protein
MTYQIFPNRFKSLGKALFLVCFGIPVLLAFFSGLLNPFESNENISFAEQIMTSSIADWLELFSILGLLIYMLSKEKVEDDYINKLRLESFQITTLFSIVASFIVYFFDRSFELSLSYFIFLFIFTFLVTFSFKKRIN